MDKVINYIFNMLPIMFISIPFFIIMRIIIYKFYLKIKVNWYHEILLLILYMLIIGLISQALTGNFSIKNVDIDNINFIPFKILVETYQEVFINNNINYFIINFLGNIIMFIPLGLIIPILFKTNSLIVILSGFCFSLFIEISQLFLIRGTDIDDIIFNALGTFLGLLIYKLLSKKFKIDFDKYKLIKNESWNK